jgi:hypothetical protein
MFDEPLIIRPGLVRAARTGMSFGAAVRNRNVAFDERRFRYTAILSVHLGRLSFAANAYSEPNRIFLSCNYFVLLTLTVCPQARP